MSPHARGMSRRQLWKRLGLLTSGVGLVSLLQGCGSEESAQADQEVIIAMDDQLRFVPDHVTVRPGQTVTWHNGGSMVHTATSDPAKAQNPENGKVPDDASAWDSGLIRAGESWSVTLAVAGDYRYFCLPHEAAGMVGTITVED